MYRLMNEEISRMVKGILNQRRLPRSSLSEVESIRMIRTEVEAKILVDINKPYSMPKDMPGIIPGSIVPVKYVNPWTARMKSAIKSGKIMYLQ